MSELGTAYLRVLPDTNSLNAKLGAYFGGSQFSKMGKVAGVALGAGIAAGGAAKALYEVGEAFDDASDKIRVGTGATGKQLGKLEENFKNVVKGVPADFDSASTAIADLNTRLGLSGKPLERMSKQITELSRITETDVGSNVKGIARAFVDWEVNTKKQSTTLDGFFRLAQASGATVDDLTTSVQQFGSPLRQLGFSLEESAAMFATFERAGVNTETMVPGLKFAISNLTRPTETLGLSMEKLGIAAGKPDKALRQIFELLGDESKLSQVKRTGLAMDVFGRRAGADMAEAIQQGRFEFEGFVDVMENGRDTIRKAGRDTMDFDEHWQQFKNTLAVAVEPVATRVFQGIGKEMRKITKILGSDKLTGEEKLDALMDNLSSIAERALPKVAKAAGKIGGALAKGVAKAFLDGGALTKLFIGASLIRLVGGKGALLGAGGVLGKVLGTGAGTGIKAGLMTAAKRAGLIGVGVTIGSELIEGITNQIKSSSDDIMEALGGETGFQIEDMLPGQGLDAQEVAGRKLKATLEGVAEMGGRFTAETREGVEALARQVDLTREQRISLNALLDQAQAKSIKAGTIFDVAGFDRALSGVNAKFSDAFDLGDIRQATKSNLAEITSNFDKGTTEQRRLITTNFYAARDAVREAMADGKISSKKGMAYIESLAKKFDITQIEHSFKGVKQSAVENLKGAGKAGDRVTEQLARNSVDIRRELGKLTPTFKDVEQDARKSFAGAGDAAKEGNRRVSGNVGSMGSATLDALKGLGKNLNQALSKLGSAKSVSFDWSTLDGRDKAKFYARGGITPVPGTGTGDKVPAMLEPGEVIVNRKAVAAMGGAQHVDRINHLIPRYATGGVVGLAAGGVAQPPGDPGSEVVQAAYAGAVGSFLKRWNMNLTQGYNPGGPSVSPGHLSLSAAPSLDVAPLNGDWGGSFLAGLKWAVSQGWKVIYGSRGVGMSLANHGEGNHAHIDWGSGTKGGGGGAAFEEIARVLLEGPDGPLKDIGQGGLDKARKAANAYLKKMTPTESGAHGGDVISGDGDVERVFAQVAKKLSKSPTATLALGEAGYAESGMRDLSYGDSTSLGALQLLSSTASGMGINPHDEGQVASAFLQRGFFGKGGANKLADQGLPAHLVAQGVQGSAFSSGSNYAAQAGPAKSWMSRFGLQDGGIVQMLAEGGVIDNLARGGKVKRRKERRRDRRRERREDRGESPSKAGKGKGKDKRGKGKSKPALDKPALDLGGVNKGILRKIGKAKPKKRRGALRTALSDLSKFGFDQKILDKLEESQTLADEYSQYADRANSLTESSPLGLDGLPLTEMVDGKTKIVEFLEGIVKGKPESGWLADELQQRFSFRNSLVWSQQMAANKIEEATAAKEAAAKQLTRIAKAFRGAQQEQRKQERRIEGAKKKIESARDVLDRQMSKPRKKRDQGTVKRQRQIINQQQGVAQDARGKLGAAKLQVLQRGRRRDALRDEIVPGLRDQIGDLGGVRGDLLGDLVGVQGLGGSMKILKSISSKPTGEWGGDIFSIQMRLDELGKRVRLSDPDKPDEPDAPGPLRIDELLRFAEAVKYAGLPGYAGAFAAGGMIPSGQWGIAGEAGAEIVQGPAQVHSNADSLRMMDGPRTMEAVIPVDIHLPDGGVVRQMIRTELREKDRTDDQHFVAGVR